MLLYFFQHLCAIAIGQRKIQRNNVGRFMQVGKEIIRRFEAFDFVLRIKGKIMLEHRAIPCIIFQNKYFERIIGFHHENLVCHITQKCAEKYSRKKKFSKFHYFFELQGLSRKLIFEKEIQKRDSKIKLKA